MLSQVLHTRIPSPGRVCPFFLTRSAQVAAAFGSDTKLKESPRRDRNPAIFTAFSMQVLASKLLTRPLDGSSKKKLNRRPTQNRLTIGSHCLCKVFKEILI